MAEPPIADRSIHILAIEADPVIQSGLITCLNRFPDLQVSAEAEDPVSAWQILTNPVSKPRSLAEPLGTKIDLILLGLPLSDRLKDRSILAFWQQVKSRFPNLPILLLALPQDRLTTAFQVGIEGCALRGSSILDLVASIRQVAAGQTSWAPEILERVRVGTETRATNSLTSLRQRLRLSSLQQIETALAELDRSLNTNRLSAVEQLVLAGRKRELNTARWLVKRLFPPTEPVLVQSLLSDANTSTPSANRLTALTQTESSNLNPLAQTLFDRIAAKLQSSSLWRK